MLKDANTSIFEGVKKELYVLAAAGLVASAMYGHTLKTPRTAVPDSSTHCLILQPCYYLHENGDIDVFACPRTDSESVYLDSLD